MLSFKNIKTLSAHGMMGLIGQYNPVNQFLSYQVCLLYTLVLQQGKNSSFQTLNNKHLAYGLFLKRMRRSSK